MTTEIEGRRDRRARAQATADRLFRRRRLSPEEVEARQDQAELREIGDALAALARGEPLPEPPTDDMNERLRRVMKGRRAGGAERLFPTKGDAA